MDGALANLLAVYANSVLQGFESYLRNENDFVENGIKFALNEFSSKLLTYEILPGISSFKNLSEVLSRELQKGCCFWETIQPNVESDAESIRFRIEYETNHSIDFK